MPQISRPTPEANAVRPAWAKDFGEFEYQFVCEYLVDMNGTQAVLRIVGEDVPRQTAAQRAWDTFRRPRVRLAINRALSRDSSATQQWLVDELARVVDGDVTEFMRQLVTPLDLGGFVLVPGWIDVLRLSELPPEKRRLIKKLKIDEMGRVTFELYSRMEAIEKLGKTRVVGLFGEDSSKGDGASLEDLLARVEKKMAEARTIEGTATTIEQPALPAIAKPEDSSS